VVEDHLEDMKGKPYFRRGKGPSRHDSIASGRVEGLNPVELLLGVGEHGELSLRLSIPARVSTIPAFKVSILSWRSFFSISRSSPESRSNQKSLNADPEHILLLSVKERVLMDERVLKGVVENMHFTIWQGFDREAVCLAKPD